MGSRLVNHRRDEVNISAPTHYGVFSIGKAIDGMAYLRRIFPDDEANYLNFVLFSTSGVHGSYITIEEIERGMLKYGEDYVPDDDWPDDWNGRELTILLVQPRVVCLRYGNVLVESMDDINWLKRLRKSSFDAISEEDEQERRSHDHA